MGFPLALRLRFMWDSCLRCLCGLLWDSRLRCVCGAQFNKQEWRSYADLVALKQSSFSRVQLADKE